MKTSVYLDNAATMFPKPPEVVEAVHRCISDFCVNAGRGAYGLARRASALIDETRALIAAEAGMRAPERVILLPSATIALNQVIHGLAITEDDNLYFTPFEHNSVLRPLDAVRRKTGANLIKIPINGDTHCVDFEALEELFKTHSPKLVCITQASNVFGNVLPVAKLAKLSRAYGGYSLVDGSQGFGHVDYSIAQTEADMYVFAGHKGVGGLLGVGALALMNNKIDLEPLFQGGTGNNSNELLMPETYPLHLEAGSPDITAITALNAGLKWLTAAKPFIQDKELFLRSALIEYLGKIEGVQLYENVGSGFRKIPVISFNLDGLSPQEVVGILDAEAGIAVRGGLHCAPLAHAAVGTAPNGTIRVSLSWANEMKDIELLAAIVKDILE